MNSWGGGISRMLDSLKLESQKIVNDVMWVLGTEQRSWERGVRGKYS